MMIFQCSRYFVVSNFVSFVVAAHGLAFVIIISVACFIVSEMTYTVSSGTLNSTIPYYCHIRALGVILYFKKK